MAPDLVRAGPLLRSLIALLLVPTLFTGGHATASAATAEPSRRSSVRVQEPPAVGFVTGRVVDADGVEPVASASVAIVRFDDGALHTVVEGKSGSDGRFRLAIPPLPERCRLLVRAVGRSPWVAPLTTTPRGEGLLLPDVRLERGARLETVLAPAHVEHAATLRLRLVLGSEDGVVDLDAPALLEAPFDGEGKATLENVPRGRALLVIDAEDRGFSPRLIEWGMGTRDESLHGIALDRGRPLALRIRGESRGRLRAEVLLASGVFGCDGGPEWRLLRRLDGEATSPGAWSLRIPNAAPGLHDLELRTSGSVLRLEHAAGLPEREVELIDATRVEGIVRAADGLSAVGGASVSVGSRRAVSDAKGRFVVPDLARGSYDLVVAAFGHEPVHAAITIVGGERVVVRDVVLGQTARLRGRVDRLGGGDVAGAWIASVSEAAERAFGTRVHGRSGADGRYHAEALPGGSVGILPLAPGEGIADVRVVDLVPGAGLSVDHVVQPGGFGEGRLRLTYDEPAAGAQVWLVAVGAAVDDRLLAADLLASAEPPHVHAAVADGEGRFTVAGIDAGVYRLVARAPGHPVFVSPPTTFARTRNRAGLDWVLPPSTAREVLIPVGAGARLVAAEPAFGDRWCFRSAESERIVLDDLQGGTWRLEPVHEVGAWPERRADERAWAGPLARDDRATLLATDAVVALDAVTPARHELDLRVRIAGDLPGARALAATIFPTQAPAGERPRRVALDPATGTTRVFLPRGLWTVLAETEDARAAAPPVLLGIHDDRSASVLDLDVPGARRIFATLAPGQVFDPELPRVTLRPSFAERLLPWTVAPRVEAFDAGGAAMLVAASRERAWLEIEGPGFGAVIPVPATDADEEIDGIELVSLPELSEVPIEAAGRIVARRRGPAGAEVARALRPDALPGLMPGTWHLESITDLLIDPVPLPLRGRVLLAVGADAGRLWPMRETVRFRGSLAMDRRRLAGTLVTLLPLADEGHRFGAPSVQVVTDDRGGFEAELSPGPHAVGFAWGPEEHESYRVHRRIDVVPLRRTDVDVDVAPLEVRVSAPDDAAAPRSGALVRLVDAESRGTAGATVFRREAAVIAWTWTDRIGRARFESVPLGRYDLVVEGPGLAETRVLDVEIDRARSPREIEVRAEAPCSLDVVVTDATGLPLAGAELVLFDGESGAELAELTRPVTDAAGRATVRGLPPGVIDVYAQTDDRALGYVGRAETFAGSVPIVTGLLADGAELIVRVIDDDDRPLGDALVRVGSGQGAVRSWALGSRVVDEWPTHTDFAGELDLSPFPAGAFRVEASLAGYATTAETGELFDGERRVVVLRLQKIPD